MIHDLLQSSEEKNNKRQNETRVSLFIAEILGKPLLSLSFNQSERIHKNI
jgi:hypothetical protein